MNLTPAQLAAIYESYHPGYATASKKLRTIIRHDVACVLAAIEASGHVVSRKPVGITSPIPMQDRN